MALSYHGVLLRKELFYQESCYGFLIGSYEMPSEGIFFLQHLMKNLKHIEKLKESCREHIYLPLGFCNQHFALSVYHIYLPIIRGDILTGVNRVDFEGEEDDIQVDINSCFELYLQLIQVINCPQVRLILEGWSRVKATSDSTLVWILSLF